MSRGPDSALTRAEWVRGRIARLIGRLPGPVLRLLVREPPVTIDGQTLDPMLQLVRKLRRIERVPGYCEPDVPTARARLRRQVRIHAGRPTPVAATRDLVIPGDDGPIDARLYVPRRGADDGSLLVYYHGGGFVVCDLESYDEIVRRLCDASGTRVLSVEYRLAPEHPFPAGLRDAATAFRWAQANATSLGAMPDRVAVGGDSAGGNLAAVVAHEAARERRPPIAQLLIYPLTDAATRRPSHGLFGQGFFLDEKDARAFGGHYRSSGAVHQTDPRVSPLLADDLSALPPTLIFTAGFDILRDEGEAYAAALAAVGVRVHLERFPSLAHSFINMTSVSRASARALHRMGTALRTLLEDIPHPEKA